jgi:hypothetical protein
MNIEGVVADFAVTSRVLRGRARTGAQGLRDQVVKFLVTALCGGTDRKVPVGGEV